MKFFIEEILENDAIKEILLADKETAKEGKRIADEIISTGDIPGLEAGFLPIFVLAHLADHVLEFNSSKGIAKEITVATLKDVNIWLDNYQVQYGKLGLGEFCWLKYHYTGDLFRLGRLQFRIEKCLPGVPEGDVAIETHIPQGEPLNIDACLESFSLAKDFFKKFYPQHNPKYFMCDSWLLNPNLAKVLPEESNIVKFMRLWETFPFPADNNTQVVNRVFGLGFKKENLKDAPENTSLQKAMKAYLLAGGEMNMAGGCRKI